MALPLNLEPSQMQTQWKNQIDPVLANLLLQGQLIANVSLVTGDNIFNHKLSRNQIGYIITDQTGAASIFRSQNLNSTTLTLNSSAPCQVSVWVF